MNEPNKVPPQGEPDPDVASSGGEDGTDEGKAGRGSLIERAARRFDFGSFIARPDPLPPEVAAKAAARSKAKIVRNDNAPTPSAPEGPVVPAAPEASAPPPRRRASDVDPALAAPAAPIAPAPEPVEEPVVFAATRHPVDRTRLAENGLIVPEGQVTALLEEFRIVKRQILLQAADLRRQKAGAIAQRVLISSPHPGEGKTYCALNLALSIAAEKESEVLLVDADFAKPSILSMLGLPGGPGLMDALIDETLDVADCVLGTDVPGLWVLPAGEDTNTDSEYLSSSRTTRVLDRLTQGSPQRIVIFDSPPALAASPAAELAKRVGQAIVIVRADKTGHGALEDAIKLLDGCPNVQLLLNGAMFSPSGRRFGSYYGYKD
ncbi:capsular biosynthesis protein [Novosphingobium profundi]|uniref:capsular biosynthesis protein n=1 Tax=Novosphingobium profundi TaxID=1774954 RepID=UPI001BDB6860|nr:capsular biosynthesis protein [Novosphingobium profundi]MBT0669126.1 capsular biosynthesis protein [Novosphingobium profundi]